MSHPDSGVLAEFRAGLIDGRRGARISAHLVSCEDCSDLCDKLAEVSVLLAAAPVPVMPDRVALRLDRVLAAEAAQRDNSERAGGHSSPGRVAGSLATGSRATGTGAGSRAAGTGAGCRAAGSRAAGTGAGGPGRHWIFRPVALRVLAPAAAAVLLAAGGYGLAQIGASSPTASTAASAPSAAPSVVHGAASASRAEARPQIEAPAAFQVVISRTDYRRATLRQQLEQQLRLHPRGAAAPPLVKACVQEVISGISPGTLQLVESAYFQGQPATVIVAVSGHQQVAWVAGGGCSATEKDLLAMTALSGTSAA
jgi:hypothetical protein